METHTPRSLRDIHGVRPDARRRPRWRDALAGLLRSAWCAFARDRLRMRAARELARKDDRMLRDIGLTRMDVELAVRGRPFGGRRPGPGTSAAPSAPSDPDRMAR